MPYTPRPIENRDIEKDGDALERLLSGTIRSTFPTYETLWRLLVWDVTARDFPHLPQDKLRQECSGHLREFAEGHYTFLRSFGYCQSLLSFPHVALAVRGGGGILIPGIEPYYSNERHLNYYLHLGRCRDMAYFLMERFERVSSGNDGFSLRYNNGRNFDENSIRKHLAGIGLGSISDTVMEWSKQIRTYRNRVHMRANAVVVAGETYYVVKPEFLDSMDEWNDVVDAVQNQPGNFIEMQALMQKHMADMLVWCQQIWGYLIQQVNQWRSNGDLFRTRLNLPSIEGQTGSAHADAIPA